MLARQHTEKAMTTGGVRTMKTIQLINQQAKQLSKRMVWGGMLVLFVSLLAATGSAATLATDKADYFPGEHVTFSGTGWQAGETVSIEIWETSVAPDVDEGGIVAIADADGNISNSDFIVQPSFLGQGFLAIATAPSGTASIAFADGIPTDFGQAANNAGGGFPLGVVQWINGDLNHNNSIYSEGMSVPQRVVFSGIPSTSDNTHSLLMTHLANKGTTAHAYDYLTSWDQALVAAEAINGGSNLFVNFNQCGPNISASGASVCAALHSPGYPPPPAAPDNMGSLLGDNVGASVAAYEARFGNRTIKIYGDLPITAATVVFTGSTASGATDHDANYIINWTSASTEIVIEFAGHLAVGVDPLAAGIGYGSGRGAGSIPGSSFHVSLGNLDGISIGNQDNQLQTSAIFIPAPPCGAQNNGPVCVGSTLQFTATTVADATYSWTGPNGFTSTQQNPSIPNVPPAAAGNYVLTVTSPGGTTMCTNTVQVTVRT